MPSPVPALYHVWWSTISALDGGVLCPISVALAILRKAVSGGCAEAGLSERNDDTLSRNRSVEPLRDTAVFECLQPRSQSDFECFRRLLAHYPPTTLPQFVALRLRLGPHRSILLAQLRNS